MHLSHSGLQLLLSCPASYFLSKKIGISAKKESNALSIGSAFHWGCEHNTDNLSGYLDEIDPYQKLYNDLNRNVVFASAMVHGWLNKKEEIYKQILTDYEGKEIKLLDEYHELDLTCNLPSYKYDKPHEFHGIIDLLLLTDHGWIILDYKTSSTTPDFDKYLDQILRYCWMIEQTFPEVPIYKIGIINVQKTGLRLKATETMNNYRMRVIREYDYKDSDLIRYYEFTPDDFTKDKMDLYIKNLSRTCDFAQTIEENKMWFINYGNAVSIYGKSQYWDLFYKTKDCEYLYKIKDPMYDPDLCEMTEYRDCVKLDMQALEVENALIHYADFKSFVEQKFPNYKEFVDDPEKYRDDVYNLCEKTFTTDNYLLGRYWNEFLREVRRDIQGVHSEGTESAENAV